MASMTLTLPEPLKAWADEQAQTSKFADVGDYVCNLIRKDQEDHAFADWLDKEIDIGLESGPSSASFGDVVSAARTSYLGCVVN
jgi:antitoxin ParD1/3/4